MLVAVKSCHYDRARGAHDLVRETWGKDALARHDMDLVFFMGHNGSVPYSLATDEWGVDALDDYRNLPYKTRGICRLADELEYDSVFLTDTGSFIIPDHLANYGWGNSDYVGYWGLRMTPVPYYRMRELARGCSEVVVNPCYPWAAGGGYFLTKKAFRIVAEAEPVTWAEDCSTAQVLARSGINLDDRAKAGFKGYVVDWIHRENNDAEAFAKRKIWMHTKYEQSKRLCAEGLCDNTKKIEVRDETMLFKPEKVFPNLTPWNKSR